MKKYLRLTSILILPLMLCSCEKALDETTAAERYQAMFGHDKLDYPKTLEINQSYYVKIKQSGINVETKMNSNLNVDENGYIRFLVSVGEVKVELLIDESSAYLSLKSGKETQKIRTNKYENLGSFDGIIQTARQHRHLALTEAKEMLDSFVEDAASMTPKAYADGNKCRFVFKNDDVNFSFSTIDGLFCGYKINADASGTKLSIKMEIGEYDGTIKVKSPLSYTFVNDFSSLKVPGLEIPGL